MFLLLTLNIFHTFFCCFSCWFWTSKCYLDTYPLHDFIITQFLKQTSLYISLILNCNNAFVSLDQERLLRQRHNVIWTEMSELFYYTKVKLYNLIFLFIHLFSHLPCLVLFFFVCILVFCLHAYFYHRIPCDFHHSRSMSNKIW